MLYSKRPLARRRRCIRRMGQFSEFSPSVRAFLKTYRWRRIDPVPWAPLRKPIAECRFVLVSSAGFVLPDQKPFDDSIRGGDWSHREIPSDSDVADLIDTQRSRSYEHAGVRDDPNAAFPIDRARELLAAGRIGSLARSHVSLMGSITAPARLLRDTAPDVARLLRADGVDVALLVPV